MVSTVYSSWSSKSSSSSLSWFPNPNNNATKSAVLCWVVAMRQDIHARGQGQERLSSAIATTSFAVFCRTAQNGSEHRQCVATNDDAAHVQLNSSHRRLW